MKSRRGVTIAEMVIYLGILSVLLVVFINLFAVLVDRQLETEALSSTQYDSTYLLSRFTYDFGRASSIEIPALPGSSSAMLRLIISGETYDYSASDGALIVLRGGNIHKLTSSETTVSTPQFIRYGNGSQYDVIQIDFMITSVSEKRDQNETVPFSTLLGIRDK